MDFQVKDTVSDFDRIQVPQVPVWSMPKADGLYRLVLKRALDIFVVLLALPIIALTIGSLAALIALDGHSPFYTQKRVGRSGQIFTLWKLRTMIPDADGRLAAHLSSNEMARREWEAYQKLSKDPRITPLGQFLRKSSLDELPQLWNVLKGEMSLVGPRPMMPEQRTLYAGSAYFLLRPGLTGLWQVSDRNNSTFAQRAEFDTIYERELSWATDLRLLVATVGVVLRGTGL